MNSLMQKVIAFVLISGVAAAGCGVQIHTGKDLNHQRQSMEAGERRANARAGEELVAFMSFDTLFQASDQRSLAEAAGKGRAKRLRTLVGQGVDVNSRGNKGATALFWALREGSVRGFTTLLELGADPNVIFDDGGSVMHWAVRNRNPAFLEAALAHGGNPNLKAGQFDRTPIFEALGERRDRLDLLLAAGADVNAESELGTPAYVAARRGSFDVVYRLLEHGAEYHELYQWLERTIVWLESDGRVAQHD